MLVAEVVGRALAESGVEVAFGLVGSGNFHVTNALVAAGARFVPAAHEGGAATMADAYARVSGKVAVLSLHQGPGVTNALTGIAEAAKSRTPLVVLAPEATTPNSNFHIDLAGVACAVGADFIRVRAAESTASDVLAACRAAARGRTVVLGLPLDVQPMVTEPVAWDAPAAPEPAAPEPAAPEPAGRDPSRDPVVPQPQTGQLAEAVLAARRPVFIAGRGAASRGGAARAALARLADRCGALLAVSAAAKGLFAGDPWYLDICGGFGTPLAAELVAGSDLVVAWGSTLNMWTTRHGRLVSPRARVVQVDHDPAALGRHRPVDLGVPGDVVAVADAVLGHLAGSASTGWREPALRERIVAEGRWRDVSYAEDQEAGRVDPRTLSIALDDLLPEQRTVAVDSGNFMGYPSMYLAVPDVAGFCFTQSYQSVGLGLASAIGTALARPDRIPVAALGDGGFLMSVAELTTAVRLRLPLLVVVYNDAAYGAEVHHFGPAGHPLETVRFPDTDLAAIGRGFGCAGVTVRTVADLAGVRDWLSGPPDRPLVVDAKVSAARGSWWLEEAFRGH